MRISPAAEAQLATIGWLQAVLAARGTDHWVFGGWAVELHLGRTSRDHADVDVAIWAADRAAVEALLFDGGWAHTPEAGEDGYTAYTRGGVRVELAFLERAGDGTVYTPLANGRGSWPAGSFGDEEGEVDGVRSRVVGLASLVEDKSGPRADPVALAKDRADVGLLTAELVSVQEGSAGSIVRPGGTTMRIQEILSSKGFDVVHARPDSSVGDLVILLREHNLGAVVVSPDGRQVTGIVSERDVVRHLDDESDLLSRPLSAIMTTEVRCCTGSDTVEDLMGVMTERRIRHLPVVDESNALVGIVSIGDLVKWQISQLQFERDQLQEYVAG